MSGCRNDAGKLFHILGPATRETPVSESSVCSRYSEDVPMVSNDRTVPRTYSEVVGLCSGDTNVLSVAIACVCNVSVKMAVQRTSSLKTKTKTCLLYTSDAADE